MKSLSNYLSIAILLFVTILLTQVFISTITGLSNNIVSVNRDNDIVGISVYYTNNTKYIYLNKTLAKPLYITGDYKILLNTTDLLILVSPIDSEIKIVTEDDIYVF